MQFSVKRVLPDEQSFDVADIGLTEVDIGTKEQAFRSVVCNNPEYVQRGFPDGTGIRE